MPSRDQIPKGKKQLNIVISEELYRQIIEVVPAWYGKLRGGISALVEEALKQYLASLRHAQNTQNPQFSVSGVKEDNKREFERVRRLLEDIEKELDATEIEG